MANRARALPDNVEGPIFVDSTCIDCDTCRQLAPATFGETGDFSFVKQQPRDAAEHLAALRALVACPTGSIGTADKQRVAEAVNAFPMPLDGSVIIADSILRNRSAATATSCVIPPAIG